MQVICRCQRPAGNAGFHGETAPLYPGQAFSRQASAISLISHFYLEQKRRPRVGRLFADLARLLLVATLQGWAIIVFLVVAIIRGGGTLPAPQRWLIRIVGVINFVAVFNGGKAGLDVIEL